ncbi:MAG: hypothetical protein ABI627_22990, partial [Polyangiaceae bacterium]
MANSFVPPSGTGTPWQPPGSKTFLTHSQEPGRAPVHVEAPRADELSPRQAAGPDPLSSGRDAQKRVRTRAAAVALASLPRRPRQVPREIAVDPKFAQHNRRRVEWLRKRLAELQAAHGSVSHGVGAILGAAGWLHAAGEFAAEQAAAEGNVDGFKLAGTLTTAARGHELAAWELCAREAINSAKSGGLDPELAAFLDAAGISAGPDGA